MIDSKKEIQDRIIEIIERTLSNERVDPSEFFFKEGDFADALDVGRSTIREAITSLEIRGYVKRVHGRGIQAIDRSIEAVTNSINDLLMRSDFEYSDVLQFRQILEVKGAGLAAVNRTDTNLRNLERYIDNMTDQVSYKAYLDADFSFHKEVIRATQNKMLEALISAYSRIIRYMIEMATDEDYRPEVDHAFHRNILDAITAGDQDAAEATMAHHLSASALNAGSLKKINTISW